MGTIDLGRSSCDPDKARGFASAATASRRETRAMSSPTVTLRLAAATLTAFLTLATDVMADTITAVAARDNTLYQTTDGSLSNGAGIYLFAGRTAQLESLSRRRALLYFNLAGLIPPGSTVDSATLSLHMSRSISASELVGVHRVSASWGEGVSDAPGEEGTGGASATDDATWLHTRFDTETWSTPGGDFTAIASAMLNVVGLGPYSWPSTQAMIGDVQSWVDDPSANFGWALVGYEGAVATAKRFDSRENSIAENRPMLTVEFTPPPNVPAASTFSLAILAACMVIAAASMAKKQSMRGAASKG